MKGRLYGTMARSRKKVGVLKDNARARQRKAWKKIFNRRIRRIACDVEDDLNGKAYRKHNCPWIICDYRSYYNENDRFELEDEKYKWFMK